MVIGRHVHLAVSLEHLMPLHKRQSNSYINTTLKILKILVHMGNKKETW